MPSRPGTDAIRLARAIAFSAGAFYARLRAMPSPRSGRTRDASTASAAAHAALDAFGSVSGPIIRHAFLCHATIQSFCRGTRAEDFRIPAVRDGRFSDGFKYA